MQKLTWPAVGLLAVISAVVVALATLTTWGSGEIIGVVGILAGIGGGAAVAGGVAGKVEEVKSETAAQTPILQAVARQTNGALEARDRRISELESTVRQLGGMP